MRRQGTISRIVRSHTGGQVTIPEEFREALGIDAETPLQVTLTDGELRIKPMPAATVVPDSSWLRDAYEAFAPIREELAEKYSEEEINDAIDQAVKAVRQANAARGL
jgi:bifunctional DNA-binding transcriptional regulator/antitoxin component of YhaV-PrlF toxin-antitoxin module